MILGLPDDVNHKILFEYGGLNHNPVNKIMKDRRIVEISEMLISHDRNTSNDKIEALQTWLYFKPPGELGRDVHQNILIYPFYIIQEFFSGSFKHKVPIFNFFFQFFCTKYTTFIK